MSAQEQLYFSHTPVRLKPHKGSFVEASGLTQLSAELASHEDKQIVLSRLDSSPEYPDLILPAIPAIDIVQSEATPSDGFSQCLIKCAADDSKDWVEGFASGVRSGLIKSHDGKWIRLKGCGNDTEGFITQKVDGHSTHWSIRGSSFKHTTLRELYMSEAIQQKCSSVLGRSWTVGNTPIGYFKYDSMDHNFPELYCTVMQTFGDRRLGDHILVGLEQLLPLFYPNIDFQQLSKLLIDAQFPPDRIDSHSLEISPSWLSVLTQTPTLDATTLDLPQQLDLSFPPPNSLSDQYQSLWHQHLTFLSSNLQPNLLPRLYRRLGLECGRFTRALHAAEISWGTYMDALGTHCNAHANNLILLQSSTWLLAPLDFDMAFSRQAYLPLTGSATFDELLLLEKQGFRLTLAGDEQASTGVKGVAGGLREHHTALKWLLRDTLLSGFDSGLAGEAVAEEVAQELRVVLELALMCTSDKLA